MKILDRGGRKVYNYRMSITENNIIIRNFFLGFIRLHILYHASQQPIFGLDMIQELASHGYQLSPGTLYPVLHGLERDGFLCSEKRIVRGKMRKYYRATSIGKETLAQALEKVHELLKEIDIQPHQ